MAIVGIMVFIFGLAAGVVLNFCIDRLPQNESIFGKKLHCMECGVPLKPVECVGILRFILFKGKCGYCRERISLRYPAVELLTGTIYVMLFVQYGISMEFLFFMFLMSILIAVFFIDLAHKIIPDELVIAGLAGSVPLFVYNLFLPFPIYGDRLWWNPLAGILAGSGFLFAAVLAGIFIYKTSDALGMGDVKIFAPIGVFLGWRMTIVTLLLAIISAGVAGLVLKIFAKKDWKYEFPYGPFIVAAAFVTIMWGWDLLNWYINRL